MSERRWCFMDLVTDPASGKLRETLVWSNIGKLAGVIWFSRKCYLNTDTPDLWLIVMGVLTCHAAFSQFLMARVKKK